MLRTKSHLFVHALISIWITVSLYIDIFEHMQGAVESFFRTTHLFFYTGVALATGWVLYKTCSAPTYPFKLPGVGVFLMVTAFPVDLTWHSLFGFENHIEGLVSPAHIYLITGWFLFCFTPFYILRNKEWDLPDQIFVCLSFALSLASVKYMLLFTSRLYIQGSTPHATTNLLIQILLVALFWMLVHDRALPFGFFTAFEVLSNIGVALILDTPLYLLLCLSVGLYQDVLWTFRHKLRKAISYFFMGMGTTCLFIIYHSFSNEPWSYYWGFYASILSGILCYLLFIQTKFSVSDYVSKKNSTRRLLLLALGLGLICLLYIMHNPIFTLGNNSSMFIEEPRDGLGTMLILSVLLMPVFVELREYDLPPGILGSFLFSSQGLIVLASDDLYLLLPLLLSSALIEWFNILFSRVRSTLFVPVFLICFWTPLLQYNFFFNIISWSTHIWMGGITLSILLTLAIDYVLQFKRSEINDTIYG